MATLEEHVIKISHVSDTRDLERIRAEARKAAQEIEKAFERAARGAGESADDIADEHEDAAKKTSEVWTGALREIGARLTNLGISAAKATASYVADTFEAVRETDLFAQTLGVATTSMLALEKGFERARVPADNTREAVKTLRENLGEMARVGTGPAVDSLGSLGLKLEDLNDKNPEEQLKILADALKGVSSESKRTSIAIELMGEDGQRIMPAMLDGAAGVDALTQAARDAGQVLDEKTIKKTRELDEALLGMKGQAEGVALTVLEATVPAFTDAAERASAWADKNQELIDQDLPEMLDAATAAFGGIIEKLGTVVELFASAKRGVEEFGGVLGPVMEYGGMLADWSNPTNLVLGAAESAGEVADATISGTARGGIGAALEENRPRGAGVDNPLAFDPVGAGRAAIRRVRAAQFEEETKNPTKKKKGSKKDSRVQGELTEEELEIIADFVIAQPELASEFGSIGDRFGVTEGGLARTRLAAAKSLRGGGNRSAARKAGLSTLGRLTDTDNIEKQISRDPLSALFGVEGLPDASPADIAQDRAPQVLTATINNTFTIEQRFNIDGSSRPDLIPDSVTDAVRRLFSDEVERQSTYVANPFAR